MDTRLFKIEDTEAVVAIWQKCGLTRSWNNPYLDIQRKVSFQPQLFFVGELDGQVMATAMFGYDGHRGWLNYFAVLPEYQGKGYGRQFLEFGETELKKLGCPKLNFQIRMENTGATQFYEAHGYVPDAAVSYGRRLISDE